MKYTAILVTLVAGVFAIPQQGSSASVPATTAAVALTPQQTCLNTCNPADVTCRAACLGIARPNSKQAVDTNECVAKCDQGDGSKEATEKYGQCRDACIASIFPSTQTIAPFAPGGVASNAASATNAAGSAAASGASRASGSAASITGSGGAAASASNTPGAAALNGVQFTGVGLAGLVAAIFAL
ncbi:hypothetical protein B0J11DRAFT_506998 [Dendryphion nanum]|uniref:HFB protein n=1 Tax=Dendryphion nanum TaxID=256645 RepID=A0A9P9DRZ6_9PLEO|nr:hypothetical protein B0J11DRAFT_506998 [Dendryphion nanum]